MTRITIKLSLLLFAFTSFFITPGFTSTVGHAAKAIPASADFSVSIENGESNRLRGIRVPDVMAFPIIQQPAEDPYYVSNHDGEVTQFSIASQYGNIGLLAHNTLSGRSFSKLSPGQEVELFYGDGRIEKFIVTEVLHFQALQPQSQQSSFLNLDNSELLSADQMFKRVYTGSRHLTFQTCITANGNVSWGRLFVVATPKEN